MMMNLKKFTEVQKSTPAHNATEKFKNMLTSNKVATQFSKLLCTSISVSTEHKISLKLIKLLLRPTDTSRFKPAFIVTLLCLFFTSANALPTDNRLLQPRPGDNWQTLSTPHFNIHYAQDNKDFAQRMAVIAEKVHAELQPFYPYSAIEKTEVVINDAVDFSNGAATPVPYNQFFLYMHAPAEGDLMSHNDWTELVFRHEYTHILHTNQVTGGPEKLRKVLGKAQGSLFPLFLYPQAWAPSWTAEGFAMHQESILGYGRTGSAISDAKMRHEVLKDGISLSAISYEGYNASRWPYGQNYTYGAYFFEFLEREYDNDTINNYINNYSNNLIPWRIHSRAREATGLDGKALWAQYQNYLSNKYQPQITQIKAQGEMPGKVITSEPYLNHHLTSGPKGSIYYYHSDGLTPPEIRQLHSDGKHATVTQLKSVSLLNWHPKSGLLVGRADVCDNRDLFKDLYQISPGHSKPVPLTHCARILHADWAPDGKSIYAVQNESGRYQLVHFTPGEEIKRLKVMNPAEVLGDLSVSPDGSTLVISVKRSGEGWNLEQVQLKSNSWQKLTNNNDLETQPQYSNDGKNVLFISDRGNRMELRALNLNDQTVTSLTNSIGYIIEGITHKDGSTWVSEYTGNGEVIRRWSGHTQFGEKWSPTNPETIKVDTISAKSGFNPGKYNDSKPYNALDTIKPTGWTPLLALASSADSIVGLQISGQDALGFHEWMVSPIVFFNDETTIFGGIASYDYDGRFSVFASRELDSNYVNDAVSFFDIEDNLQFLFNKHINHIDWSLTLSAGIGYERVEREQVLTAETLQGKDILTGGTINYNSLNYWLHSIIPTDGYTASLTVETYDWLGNSAHSGVASVLSVGGYYNLGNNNTVTIKGDLGYGEDNIEPYRLGDHRDSLSSLGGITKLGRREFALRGYDNHPELTGSRLLKLAAEWHTPIATIYDGFNIPPIGVGEVYATAFIDTGRAWDSGGDKDFFTGIGAEVTTEVLLGYDSINLPITIGVAFGLDKDIGEEQLYLTTGFSF